MNFDAFSHGQILSKIWLCEELERYAKYQSTIWILGSWYNVLGFMLHIRKPDFYKLIVGYDFDNLSINISEKICEAFTVYHPITVNNIFADANKLDWSDPPQIVINCSFEHFSDNSWFDSIPNGTLVCLQTTNITNKEEPWLVKQPTSSINEFKNKFILSQICMFGIKPIQLNKNGKYYERYMMIGYK